MSISKSNLDFLRKLSKNNTREWFNANKDWYQREHQNMIEFADALINNMNQNDQIETASGKRSLFRIYRDVRFSKDKSPYKINWSGSLKRATAYRRGGYYYHIQPGNSFAAGGFWGPSASDLSLIRSHIAQDDSRLREVISTSQFKKFFGELWGDKVKTAPKGYSKEDPAIDLLRYKQFLVSHKFSDKEVLAPDFADKLTSVFVAMHPFFDYMSEILTTDLNGISLLE